MNVVVVPKPVVSEKVVFFPVLGGTVAASDVQTVPSEMVNSILISLYGDGGVGRIPWLILKRHRSSDNCEGK